MEERIERVSDRRRREEKWQTCWCCRDQQRACRMAQASAEKLEHCGSAEKERVASVPQREQLASTPEPPLPRGEGTEPSVQSARSWVERESRWARAAPWREARGSQQEHEEEKVDSTVKEGRFQGGQGGQATRASLGEVEGSMSGWVDAKALQDDLQSFGFTSSLAKPEGGWETKSPLIRWKSEMSQGDS